MERQIRVTAVPRDEPDIHGLVTALMMLLEQLSEEEQRALLARLTDRDPKEAA